MNRRGFQKRTGFFWATAVAALLVSACAGSPETRVVQKTPGGSGGTVPRPEIGRPDLIQPALNTISARIRSHEARLEEIRAIENNPNSMMIPHDQMGRLSGCKSELLDILTNYDGLQKKLLRETDLDTAQALANDTLLQVNQQDMQFLEGGCGRLLSDLKSGQGMVALPPAVTSQPLVQSGSHAEADAQIQEAFAAGEYARLIGLYNQRWTGLGRSPAPLTTWQYGQALLKNHQPEEAERVLSALDRQFGPQSGDPLAADVLRTLGDIAFGAGNYDAARQRYERLVRLPSASQGDSWAQRQLAVLQQQTASADELAAYATLVRNYLAYTPSRDGYAVAEQAEQFLSRYPASRLVANVNTIHKQTREEAEAWLKRGVQRIERRVDGGTAGAGTERPTGGTTVGDATAQAPLSPEQSAARNQALQEQYDRGLAHMAAKEYDQALDTFSSLLGSDFTGQARERIQETAALAGEDNRQKAAELFVRASQVQDPESRRKLLLASRQLLKDILVKYPQSSLSSKVERNLASVEQALRAIDPALPGVGTAAGAVSTGQGL